MKSTGDMLTSKVNAAIKKSKIANKKRKKHKEKMREKL